MPAPQGNRNAVKDDGKTHWIKMRVRPQDKSSWVQAAQEMGVTLSVFMEKAANRFIGENNGK